MLNCICEYFPSTTPVPLALSAASPAARRAVESSTRGYMVKGLRLHHEDFRRDEEVSCHRRPTRTVCIHAETLPQTFLNALWWMEKDGDEVPVVFRAARLTGSLHYGAALAAAGEDVRSTHNRAPASLVRRTVSLYLGGSRVRDVCLDPTTVAQLERIDVSNCRCLKTLRFTNGDEVSGRNVQPLRHLRTLKASFSGLTTLPATRLVEWAPAITTVLLSGCRALSEEQLNGLLEDCTELRVARLDSTKLSSIEAIALTCPHLVELNVSNCGDLQDVTTIAALSCLRVLNLHSNVGLTSLDGVGQCRRLRQLDISHCKRVSTLAPLEGTLTQLRHFNASHCTGLRDTGLRALQTCLLLEEVKVNQCAALRDLSALSHHTNLMTLEAADTGLASVDFLRTCTALERLSVAGCVQLKDLAALQGLYYLTSVDACHSGVTRLAELVDSCVALRVMLVRDCNLDVESTNRLEACSNRIASTHRKVSSSNRNSRASA
jgi:hypothetical protein